MNLIAQIIGLVATICIVSSIQFQTKKKILFFLLFGNALFGLSYLLLGAYAGAVVCIIATVETYILYCFDLKNKLFPKWLLAVFFITALTAGVFTFKNIYDLLPIVGSFMFILLIIQKKEKSIRLISLFLAIIWIIYSIIVGAYTAVLSDVFYFVSVAIAIIRYDIINKKKVII